MNQITKHIWLGGGGDVATLDKANTAILFYNLKKPDANDVDALLNCTGFDEIEYESGKPFCRVPVRDEEIIPLKLIHRAMKFIDEQVRANKTVLVHCMGGVSRSPSIVTCYLALTHGMTPQDALKYVRSKRNCVDPHHKTFNSVLAYIEDNTDHEFCPSPLL